MQGMARAGRRRDRAIELADRDLAQTGVQIRIARRGSGLSLRAAATAVGIDHGTLSLIERHLAPNVTVRQLGLACSAVGLDLRLRTYLAGDAPRDAAQLRLLNRFRVRLPNGSPWATEVPLPIPGDLRALDGWTRLEKRTIGVEAETRLDDLQALERRALLKKRDAALDVLILLVGDTGWNREVLSAHREAMRASFPLDTRAILAAISHGHGPAADGIVVL